jgi:NADP-reducing hydrogenase subunit HndC
MVQGAQEIFDCIKTEVKKYQLEDEVSIAMASDISRMDIAPVVVVYPEAVVYGPMKVEVFPSWEEHLYKGRVANRLQAPKKALSGPIAWLSAREGSLPADNASFWNAPGHRSRIDR